MIAEPLKVGYEIDENAAAFRFAFPQIQSFNVIVNQFLAEGIDFILYLVDW